MMRVLLGEGVSLHCLTAQLLGVEEWLLVTSQCSAVQGIITTWELHLHFYAILALNNGEGGTGTGTATVLSTQK